jgi:hypothetical protein
MIKILPIVFYLVFIHSYAVLSQMDESTSIEIIVDKKDNVKRFDIINYQILADQNYYKNNPEQQSTKDQTPLDELQSSSELSADSKQKIESLIPLDQQVKNSPEYQVALDSKLLVSEENKLDKGSFTETSNVTELLIAKESAELESVKLELDSANESSNQTDLYIAKESIELEDKKAEENQVLTVESSKNELDTSQILLINQEKSVELPEQANLTLPIDTFAVKSHTIDIPQEVQEDVSKVNQLEIEKDNVIQDTVVKKEGNVEKIVKKTDKYVDYKVVDPIQSKQKEPIPKEKTTPVKPNPIVENVTNLNEETPQVKIELPDNQKISSNKEKEVIDGLIKSGMYDVHDDGKYIKISKKKYNK